MTGKRHKPDERAAKRRRLDAPTANGKSIVEAVKRLEALELENARLRQAVSDLTLDKLVLAAIVRAGERISPSDNNMMRLRMD